MKLIIHEVKTEPDFVAPVKILKVARTFVKDEQKVVASRLKRRKARHLRKTMARRSIRKNKKRKAR